MKNKITILALALAVIVMHMITGCQNKRDSILGIPEIPKEYNVDQNLYLAEGDGIYALIEDNTLDYDKIRAEICNGNAQAVNASFEKSGVSKKNPKEYAAIQNILGITEVYLGNYDMAYEYFYETIDFIDKKDIQDKDKILTVLYNNAGAVTYDLHRNASNDKRLKRAAKLCQEPYMSLVIAANQIGRLKADAPTQDYEKMIVQAKELIEKESQIENSPRFVMFSAVKCMSVGYIFTGQGNQSVKVLDEYIPLIPDAPEYNLVRSSLISYRGYCHYGLEEYESAMVDFQNAIVSAKRTVDKSSRQLAITYNRIGVYYTNIGDWSTGLACFKKSIPGYKFALASDKGILYWNVGKAYLELNQYEEAKKYLLKSYVNKQKVIKEAGGVTGIKSDDYVKEALLDLYQREEDSSQTFSQWLKKESKPYKAEEDKYNKYP